MNIIFDNNLLNSCYKNNGIDPSKFKGNVLVLGLGNAFVIKKINCDKLKVIEIDQEIIERYGSDYDVTKADAYEYNTNEKYDFIFIDIWFQNTDIKYLNILMERYKKNLNDNGEFIYLPLIFKK